MLFCFSQAKRFEPLDAPPRASGGFLFQRVIAEKVKFQYVDEDEAGSNEPFEEE